MNALTASTPGLRSRWPGPAARAPAVRPSHSLGTPAADMIVTAAGHARHQPAAHLSHRASGLPVHAAGFTTGHLCHL